MTTAEFGYGEHTTLMLTGDGAAPTSAGLAGARAGVSGAIEGDGGTWRATIPLATARWGGPTLPLPAGRYEIRLDGASVPEQTIGTAVRGPLSAGLRGGHVIIGPPVAADVASAQGQAALERRYADSSGPTENAVFFESFYGRTVACNPLAIDRELARRTPGVTRYWSVVDLSIPVPEGAIAVVEGSPEWWRARGLARLLVVNDWLRRRFVRRPGQRVLQTWHGTPLKRLALHRPGFDPRRAVAVVRESRRWNVLLAQNPYAGNVLRRAYAFLTRPIWVEGYPRNDILVTGDGAAVRDALGIAPEERVLLFAPTWRDDRDELVDFVDPAALAVAADAVVLVRGHSRTIHAGQDARGPRVIDATGYPDVSELLLAADALITDYSSVMFDFSVTGKPMYFLVPDLEHYRGRLRGFYFDLTERAPGPVVRSQAELERALDDDRIADRYADRYRSWQRRFNARDDGHAAQRVVSRMLDQQLISRD